MTPPLTPAFTALVAVLLIAGLLWARHTPLPLNGFDQPFYLGIAQDLVQTGRFTNGFAFDDTPAGQPRPSGMRFAPLYPALLAAISTIDPGLRAGMACVGKSGGLDPTCPNAAPVMRGLQFLELAGFFMLVWRIGRLVTSSRTAAWLTLGLALIATPLLLRSVDTLMTEMTSLLLTTAATTAALAACKASRQASAARWAAAAGILAGLAALTRPSFLYLFLAAGVTALAAAGLTRRHGWAAAAFFGTGLATIAPWIIRNTVLFGRPALSFGYDSHTLVQRIAFDTMTWREYRLAFLCWLPDGTSLGRRLVGPGACDRFQWDDQPSSFYTLGLRHMLDETLAASGGYEHHLSYLMHAYILRMPAWHMMVSVPLALRGAYVAHWWGFALLVPCLAWTWLAARRGPRLFLVAALPALFMLALNASVAVNQVRYNLMLIPPYAVAGALCLRGLGIWAGKRKTGGTAPPQTPALF